MITEQFPSRSGLMIAAIYLVAGLAAMYGLALGAIVAGVSVTAAISGLLTLLIAVAITVVAVSAWKSRR